MFKKIDTPLMELINEKDIEGIRDKICYGIIVGALFGVTITICIFIALHNEGMI